MPVAKLSLATSETYHDKSGQPQITTDWHTILQRGLAELAQAYLRKGSLVYLEGKLKTRHYDGAAGVRHYLTEIIGERLLLLDKKPNGLQPARPPMKGTVSLRLRPSRTEFLVFFPFSNKTVRTALLAAGVRFEPTAKGYVLPADAELIARVQAAGTRLGLAVLVPPTPAVALPSPTPHETLLSHYCQFIALKRYSPNTLKTYRAEFLLFLSHHAPRLPLNLTKQDVLDYLAERVARGISGAYQNLLINAIKFYYEQVEGQPRQ